MTIFTKFYGELLTTMKDHLSNNMYTKSLKADFQRWVILMATCYLIPGFLKHSIVIVLCVNNSRQSHILLYLAVQLTTVNPDYITVYYYYATVGYYLVCYGPIRVRTTSYNMPHFKEQYFLNIINNKFYAP